MTAARVSSVLGLLVAVGMAILAIALRTQGVPIETAVTFGVQAFIGPLFAAIGAIVLRRHPRHRMGWFCLGLGVASAIDEGLRGLITAQPLPSEEPWVAAAVIAADAFGNLAFAAAVIFLPLVFPDGRPAGPRWRWVINSAIGVTAVSLVTSLVEPGPLSIWVDDEVIVTRTNPLAFDTTWLDIEMVDDTIAVLAAFWFVAGIASLVTRFRRDQAARQQIKWVLLGSTVAFLGVMLTTVPVLMVLGDLISSIAFAALPVSIGIAITRYRLYEIDRLFSRTLSYAVVLILLAGLYAGTVLGLGAVSRRATGEPSDLVVAASTLVAAAAFQPLRRRVHRVVDRRFNRHRYDPARILDEFSRALRDELDVHAIEETLRAATVRTLAPRSTSVMAIGTRASRP